MEQKYYGVWIGEQNTWLMLEDGVIFNTPCRAVAVEQMKHCWLKKETLRVKVFGE